MTIPFLPFTRPAIDEATIAAVGEVLRSGWITGGPKVGSSTVRIMAASRRRATWRKLGRYGCHTGLTRYVVISSICANVARRHK